MKTFKQWLVSSTIEVQQLSDLGQKLAYALYQARYKEQLAREHAITIDPDEMQFDMIGFAN